MNGSVKILFIADTHIGFDQPLHPRIKRRRRGPDFYTHYMEALQPALDGKVDCLIHGGDLYFRSRIPDSLIAQAFDPLLEIADKGIPVIMVPGNHERGNIRQNLLETHTQIKIFNQPSTIKKEINGVRISFSGFPFHPEDIRKNISALINNTDYQLSDSDFHFLCVHQAFIGAKVGIQDYTFRNGKDVADPGQVPHLFSAILSGHIHRYQYLETDLSGQKLPVPILYPGATTRTSFAERREIKGYCILECSLVDKEPVFKHRFEPVSSRPMYVLTQNQKKITKKVIKNNLLEVFSRLPGDSIIQIRFTEYSSIEPFSASELRKMVPETMNIDIKYL